MIENTPIEELVEKYKQEECDFNDLQQVLSIADKYIEHMPDCHARCIIYALRKALTR